MNSEAAILFRWGSTSDFILSEIMSSFYLKTENFLSNEKNYTKIIIFLVVFLCAVKLPMLFTADIQPWDEGMYATRVLSIHSNGDFFDQSSHSVGRFYSGSHPPLLIWIGYASTLIFGINSAALKIVPFIFSLLCVILVILSGKRLFDFKTGFIAALIFCSNIIFNIFSKRFQFDYPYTFFILLAFYSVFVFNDTGNYRYLILSGISFGCCLMVKILVGLYIPAILFISLFILKDKVKFTLKDLIVLSAIGLLMAFPWHMYMLMKYGSGFTDYFLKFHIYDRAVIGVEHNVKNSGALYHVNYLLTIIPYSVIIFFAMIRDVFDFKKLKPEKIFLWIWFITGMIILALFKTKLEVYILLVLTPGCLLMSSFLIRIDLEKTFTKTLIIFATILNIFWYMTEQERPEIKNFIMEGNRLLLALILIIVFMILPYLIRMFADRIELKKAFYIFILIFFTGLNLYYLYKVPFWENDFQITEVKKRIESSGKKNIVYVATNYRHNPQFSFYFNGLDLGWSDNKYELLFLDTKDGTENVKEKISSLEKNKYEIIVEKEGINRAVYKESQLFIPADIKLKLSEPGYELYEN